MNPYRPDRRAGRAETERMFDATRGDAVTDPDASVDPLAGLLAAAAGPVRPGELAGEEAAMAAFRAARAAPAPAVARRPRRLRLTTSAVAWLGALAATATAGVAFAAAGLDKAPDPPPPAVPTSAPPSTTGPAATASTGPSGPTPSRHPLPSASPSVGTTPDGQVHGLCRAWRAKKPEQREKALRTPAFQRLVTAAGGVAAVEEYCQRLVPETKPSSPSPAPSAPPGPTPAAEPSPAATPPGPKKVKPSHPAGPAAN
ncbi:hypothetical protein [Micromonospora sp. NPDC005174]|uniref:hypothetical protein n=1 Tax=unclassified Micromonospora TaxID=2617518 RepID=UPI0033AF262F